jgi:diguanylate cyclase (GGDEF)-like protein
MLTGIFNRRYLHENLERVLHSMSRIDDVLSVMIIDLDFFKQYNKIYGREAGDDCLRYVAEALKSCLFRGHDFVARSGGEEFMAILPHTREAGGRLVAERMLEEVEKLQIPHPTSLVTGIVTVSIGLVTGNKSSDSWVAADFFNKADEALSLAKNQGRNQYAYLSL